ncbi:MAG: 3-dehydroquinate synthase [Ruminococcaceae bacterium]|nr:3-dehydroquinate synthase [Oscillospiraceae bacterium]
MKEITVKASKTYRVQIGAGLLCAAGEKLRELFPTPRRVMVVSDDTVRALWGDRLIASLEAAGYTVYEFVFPHGEASKTAGTIVSLWEALAKANLTRTDFVAALGGGVVGDMAGFAAATFLRGIPFVQFPTTLLAMVDSSVGGKTGADLAIGKNLIGAFHQPSAVFCDTDTLGTLPTPIFADGCAEVIKYGYINDPTLLTMLQKPFADTPEEIIARCVSDKRDLVEADERDTGARQLLNLGHTAGHAVEALSNFSISHGSAVAIGMLVMAKAAVSAGLCEADLPAHMESMLKAYHLPTACPYGAEALAKAALSDKKRKGGSITLVLPDKIGSSRLYPLAADALAAFFAGGL